MRKYLFAFLTASSFNVICPAYAQSVEEQLVTCIEDSQDILRYAEAWRKSVKEIGESPRPSEFADLLTSSKEVDTMASVLRKVMEGTIESTDISTIYEAEAVPIFLENELIRNMVQEAFNSSNEFGEMARYISLCSNNFGGDVVKLEEVNIQLERQVRELEYSNSDLAKMVTEEEELKKELNERNIALVAKNVTLQREIRDLTSAGLTSNQTLAKLRTELTDAKKRASELVAQRRELNDRISSLVTANETLRSEMGNLSAATLAAKQSVARLQNEIIEANKSAASVAEGRVTQLQISHKLELSKYERINEKLCEWIKLNGGSFFHDNSTITLSSLKVPLCKK